MTRAYPVGTMVAFASRSDGSGPMTPILSVKEATGHGGLTWTVGEVVTRPEWPMDPDFHTVCWTSGDGLPVDMRIRIDHLVDATKLRSCPRCTAMIYSQSDFCTGCTAEISGMRVRPFAEESEQARDRLARAMQEHGMSMTMSYEMARVVLNTLGAWGWVLQRVKGGSNAERDQALDVLRPDVLRPDAYGDAPSTPAEAAGGRVVEVLPLEWSGRYYRPGEKAPGEGEASSYDHVVASTPLGLATIEWKSWKGDDWPLCTFPWGEQFSSNTVGEAKRQAQVVWDRRVRSLLRWR